MSQIQSACSDVLSSPAHAVADQTNRFIHDLHVARLDHGEAAARQQAEGMINAGLAHVQARDGLMAVSRMLRQHLTAIARREMLNASVRGQR